MNTLASMEEFKRATGYSIRPTHMKDKYIILRAIGFYLWRRGKLVRRDGKSVAYRSDIEEFLGFTMEYLNRAQDKEIQKIHTLFQKVMERVYGTLGEDAFRIPTEGARRRPVSMTLFESLFYFFALLVEGKNMIEDNSLYDAVYEMFEESLFLDSLTYNVDSALHVEDRFRMVENVYHRLT